jgi:hypothetical protein
MYMLQQLRKLCAKPCELKLQTTMHTIEQRALTVGFGFKATQFILDFWNHTSAFECLNASCLAQTHGKVSEDMLPPTNYFSRDYMYSDLSDRDRRSRQRNSAPLTFVIWKQAKYTTVQPWDVIPVTRAESARFRNVPVCRRRMLISSELAAAVEARLYKLCQLYCEIINEPNDYRFAECMICSPEVHHPSMISSKECQSCSKNIGY